MLLPARSLVALCYRRTNRRLACTASRPGRPVPLLQEQRTGAAAGAQPGGALLREDQRAPGLHRQPPTPAGAIAAGATHWRCRRRAAWWRLLQAHQRAPATGGRLVPLLQEQRTSPAADTQPGGALLREDLQAPGLHRQRPGRPVPLLQEQRTGAAADAQSGGALLQEDQQAPGLHRLPPRPAGALARGAPHRRCRRRAAWLRLLQGDQKAPATGAPAGASYRRPAGALATGAPHRRCRRRAAWWRSATGGPTGAWLARQPPTPAGAIATGAPHLRCHRRAAWLRLLQGDQKAPATGAPWCRRRQPVALPVPL